MGWHGPMTHRQFLAWRAWRLADLNAPDKVCSYIMQNTVEVVRGRAKNPGEVKMADYRLEFRPAEAGGSGAKEPPESGLLGEIRARRARRQRDHRPLTNWPKATGEQ